jgi:hypothetical protein
MNEKELAVLDLLDSYYGTDARTETATPLLLRHIIRAASSWPSGSVDPEVSDELRAALERLVAAWDNGNDPDPSNWPHLDREINAALEQARAALHASRLAADKEGEG